MPWYQRLDSGSASQPRTQIRLTVHSFTELVHCSSASVCHRSPKTVSPKRKTISTCRLGTQHMMSHMHVLCCKSVATKWQVSLLFERHPTTWSGLSTLRVRCRVGRMCTLFAKTAFGNVPAFALTNLFFVCGSRGKRSTMFMLVQLLTGISLYLCRNIVQFVLVLLAARLAFSKRAMNSLEVACICLFCVDL